jgi:L-ascorbate metabolism protein UlaG (beta-lactamase superfamily)
MFLTFVLLFIATVIIVGASISAPRYKGPISDHFDGKEFFNPNGQNSKGLGDVLKWQMSAREKTPWTAVQNFEFGEKPMLSMDSKSQEKDPSVSEPNSGNLSDLRVTFVGHSTVLLQFDGWNILTDPVWYDRCSPFQWAGPKRVQPAAIRLEDLPPIDLILQSHNHWDHLDIENLKKIYQKHQPQIVTSLGISQFLKQHGIEKSVDLDWNQPFLAKKAVYPRSNRDVPTEESFFSELTITCLPAQHFSGRGMFDRNATLWSSFMVSSPTSGNIYFGGDSGYGDFFKKIGAQFGTIRLALIPIGAFKPEWFMSPIHCTPAEAVHIHLDINAEKTLAIHHGTFPLADDGQLEPVVALQKALAEKAISTDDFFVLKEGQFRDLT